MSLLVGLTSTKYAGKLGGLVGLSGYLPLANRIPKLREEAGLPSRVDDDVPIFITRGTRDVLVPKKYLTIGSRYEGMGYVLGGPPLRDLCQWLETVLPPIE